MFKRYLSTIALAAGIAVFMVGCTTTSNTNTSTTAKETKIPESTDELINSNTVTPTPQTANNPAKNSTGIPLTLPNNFAISTFSKNLGNPRVIQIDPKGTVLVSIPKQGKVVALPDKNKDGVSDETITVIDKLNSPHGLAMPLDQACQSAGECNLFIAETNAVAKYKYNSNTMKATNRQKIADLPAGGNHTTRSIALEETWQSGGQEPFPKYRLLVSIGSSCNVCNETDKRRAAILVMDLDGKNQKTFATGLRNSVFMAQHPKTNKIWATENSRDLLGDDIPPDEINILEESKNYGWPICFGKNVHDDNFDKRTNIQSICKEPQYTQSHIDLQAHSAPLGLSFVNTQSWPTEYQNNLLVAFHGSWNRTSPTGYKIVRIKLDEQGNFQGREDFISGWLTKDGQTLGRPVDIKFNAEGSAYITDDKTGNVYLLTYNK